jgi:hypothetical protein
MTYISSFIKPIARHHREVEKPVEFARCKAYEVTDHIGDKHVGRLPVEGER